MYPTGSAHSTVIFILRLTGQRYGGQNHHWQPRLLLMVQLPDAITLNNNECSGVQWYWLRVCAGWPCPEARAALEGDACLCASWFCHICRSAFYPLPHEIEGQLG